MFKKLLMCAALVAGSVAAHADPLLLDEGFDNIANLPGWGAAYLSAPAGTTGWFQGDAGVFAAESGAADSYIAANFLNAGSPAGSVDTWLATPLLAAATGVADLTFSARSEGALPGDRLEVLVANNGGGLVTDYVSLGVIALGELPNAWNTFTFQYYGIAADIRFAFRYLVDNTDVHGDYIGIDSVKVESVPEPGTLALMAMGILLTPLALRRRRTLS